MSLPSADVIRRIARVLALPGLLGSGADTTPAVQPPSDDRPDKRATASAPAKPSRPSFPGVEAGEEREVGGVGLCWCPPGRFLMGSPPDEAERRPDEDQVEVRLTTASGRQVRGDAGRLEARGRGRRPGKLTASAEGDDLPVDNVNFSEAEAFCRKLTELARNRASCPPAGSSACRPRPSGSTPAGPGRPRPPRSATRSAAGRRISRAGPTTAPRTGRR